MLHKKLTIAKKGSRKIYETIAFSFFYIGYLTKTK